VMHDGMPYGWNQGQGQGHSREVDRQSPTGLILIIFSKQHQHTFKNDVLIMGAEALSDAFV